jgi:hypothetical protein
MPVRPRVRERHERAFGVTEMSAEEVELRRINYAVVRFELGGRHVLTRPRELQCFASRAGRVFRVRCFSGPLHALVIPVAAVPMAMHVSRHRCFHQPSNCCRSERPAGSGSAFLPRTSDKPLRGIPRASFRQRDIKPDPQGHGRESSGIKASMKLKGKPQPKPGGAMSRCGSSD